MSFHGRENPHCGLVVGGYPNILWNPKSHCRAEENPPLVPIPSQMNVVHASVGGHHSLKVISNLKIEAVFL
jgi:hypothetical protein